MNKPPNTTSLLHRFGDGDEQAREALIRHAQERLRRLASKMLRTSFPVVRRWADTDDVLQDASMRLYKALAKVSIKSSRHLWRLASRQLGFALLDLAARFRAAPGLGKKHHTDPVGRAADDGGTVLDHLQDSTHEPDSLEDWTQFHEAVAQLPDDEREVVELRWYQGLELTAIADIVGVSLATINRRWKAAKVLLSTALGGELPR